MAYTQEQVEGLFKQFRVLIVTFTKKDGSKRTMECTRDIGRIPVEHHPKPLADGKLPKVNPPGLLNVYELGNGWRSFHVDKIINVEKQ